MSKPSEHAESALCFSQDEWQSLIDYGTKFLRFLEASIEEADRLMGGSTQSIWLSEEDPTNYGWVLQPHRDDGLALDFLQEVVDDIGLSNEQRDWRQVWAWHNKDWMQDGEMRHHTFAKYFATYSIKERENPGIIAKVMYGPKHMIEDAERDEGERGSRGLPRERGGMVRPHLERWSDLTFLSYYYTVLQASPGGRARVPVPKYIFIYHIRSQVVEDIIEEVERRSNSEFAEGSIETFETTDEFGKALLATVHGKAVAWFLASHKQQFGIATVTCITVLAEQVLARLNFSLLFSIAAKE